MSLLLNVFAISAALSPAPVATAAKPPSFTICGTEKRINCVVDGDTFWKDGQKIRIADIDTPEISRPQCAHELRRGQAAKRMLLSLLNRHDARLQPVGRSHDRYGRRLAIATINGRSIGEMLIRQKLARPWTGRRESWC